MKRILVAGIGNIFMGDDAFGCEVTRVLAERGVRPGVEVKDFGIRGYDLAYALIEPWEEVILVDATARGEAPGTTFLIEIDLTELNGVAETAPDAHDLNPVAVLRMARQLGEIRARIFLVGCEPGNLNSENGEMGLSAPARNAVDRALEMIDALTSEPSQTKQGKETLCASR